MTPEERKQYVVGWISRHDATQAEVADLVGVGTRAVRSWVDFSEHGRAPSDAVVRLLKVHDQ